jgi:hypothetical protein
MKTLLALLAVLIVLSLPSVSAAQLSVTSSTLQDTATTSFTFTDTSNTVDHESTGTTNFAPTPELGTFSAVGDLPPQGNSKGNGRSITFNGGWSLLIATPDSSLYNFQPNTLSGPLNPSPETHDSPAAPAPEPSSLMLLGTAILGASGFIRRKLAV